MSKAKHVLWIVALVAALAAPISWADDGSADPGFFQQLVAQLIEAIVGPEPAAALTPPGQNPELGEHIPVNG